MSSVHRVRVRAEVTLQVPALSKEDGTLPCLPSPRPLLGRTETVGKGLLGGKRQWHLCLHLPASVSMTSENRGEEETDSEKGTQKTRDKASERPRVRQGDRQAL